jgi:hypothetical protein
MYDHAGLFAWRETCESIWFWRVEQRHKMTDQAIRAVRTMSVPVSASATQAALFDPEVGQWHFVPRIAAADLPIND